MADKTFKLEIITPTKVIFNGDVVSFSAPGVVGGFQVLFNHAPMLAEIGIGTVKLQDASGNEIFFATSGGFVDVLKNNVIVLAESVERHDEIDMIRAEAARDHAKQKLAEKLTENESAETKSALDRALNRIRVAEKR
jgi:F-type H+-transporting ATPase subunit epsilon